MECLSDGKIRITWEDLDAIENNWAFDEKECEKEYRYNYQEVERTHHHRHPHLVYVTFVFFYYDKWYIGTYERDTEYGSEQPDMVCYEAESYQVTITKWRAKGKK
jgi:hypothetical protein